MFRKSLSLLLLTLGLDAASASWPVGDALRNVLIPHRFQDVMGISYQGEAGYQITLEFSNVDDTSPFSMAQDTWSGVITSDLEDYDGCSPACTANCGCAPGSIDDLYICAAYTTLPGGVLGAAGPLAVRTSNDLPLAGEMFFDNDKIASLGLDLQAIILHEMGHVVGIGTLWERVGLANSNTPTCTYEANSMASTEYRLLSGGCPVSTAIPLENDGGAGTACGHWDEVCFDNELMTGFANDGDNPFSRITIAGLDDLGYDVDYSKAEPYTTPLDCSCRCDCKEGEEEVKPPKQELSAEGWEEAYRYGQSLLAGKAKQRNSVLFPYRITEELDYVGDQVINILTYENGKIFEVMVVAEAE